MTDIQLFNIDGEGMRFGATDSGRPFVVAADFAPKLGYARSRDALRLVEEDEKGAQSVRTPGGPQEMQVLYEDGIWELIFLSRKPEAKAIKKRVKEVLRQIRETGRYEAAPAPRELDRRALAEMVIAEADRADVAEQRVVALAPAAEAWDTLADATGDHSVREAAQILSRAPGLKIGQNGLFAKLRTLRWIDGSGQPYQAQVATGRLVRRPTSYTHPHTGEPQLTAQVRITPKGIAELRKLLAGDAQLTLDGGPR